MSNRMLIRDMHSHLYNTVAKCGDCVWDMMRQPSGVPTPRPSVTLCDYHAGWRDGYRIASYDEVNHD